MSEERKTLGRAMYQFCTLFDRNYLFKGLALHQSLMRHAREFRLHILCMDGITYDILGRLRLPNVQLISLDQFEDEELRRAKIDRTFAEYCFTCSPSLPLYILKNNPEIDLITYLDADLFLFHDPSPIFEEFGDNSILIVEHRHAERFKHLLVNGIYNVEWLSFRRDRNGMQCLEWWRDRCNEWCYQRYEGGKYCDQKYLDDWLERFPGVHVLQHTGSGVAPWNFFRYNITAKQGNIFIDDSPLVFYHFHDFKLFQGDRCYFMPKMYSDEMPVPMEIYRPYIAALSDVRKMVQEVSPGFEHGIYSSREYWTTVTYGVVRSMVPLWIKGLMKQYLNRTSSSHAG